MASISNSTSVPVNVNNGNLEKAVQGDAVVKGSTSGIETGDAAHGGGAVRTGDFFGDAAKQLPIGDDLFE